MDPSWGSTQIVSGGLHLRWKPAPTDSRCFRRAPASQAILVPRFESVRTPGKPVLVLALLQEDPTSRACRLHNSRHFRRPPPRRGRLPDSRCFRRTPPRSQNSSCFRGAPLGSGFSDSRRFRRASPKEGSPIRAASGGLHLGEAGSTIRDAPGGLPPCSKLLQEGSFRGWSPIYSSLLGSRELPW
jgi:hypothetical protein